MTIGEKIRQLRREKNWTQDQLGEKLGIHGRNLCRYENDQIRPKMRMLKKLAQIFDVPIEEFTCVEGVEKIKTLIPDEELFAQFQEVAKLSDMEKSAVKIILNALIKKKQVQNLVSEKESA